MLRVLFPRRQTAERIEGATVEEFSAVYAPRIERECIVLSEYRDLLVRAAIQEIKFHNNEQAARLLASLLATWTNTHIHKPTVIIPIPLAPARLRERGYNQVERIVSQVAARQPNLIMNNKILKRRKYTKPQTQLAKAEREQNLQNAFMVADVPAVSGSHILLIDDVLTTGATIQAARYALLPQGPASLTCLALAH